MSIELLGLTLGNETISLKEPSSMVITRAWDSPAWQLDITLPHEGPLDDLTKIQVKHGTGRTLLRYLDAHAADDFGVVVQGAGSTGGTVDSKPRLDVVTHGKAKAATDIFTIQPYRLLEQGQLTNALRGQTGR